MSDEKSAADRGPTRSIATYTLALLTLASGCHASDELTGEGNRNVTEQFGNGPAGVYVPRSVANEPLRAVVVSDESYRRPTADSRGAMSFA
jgi:hypothetical protein